MRIFSASLTRPGPRATNEDFLDCWVTETGDTVACIADGLGGMGGGDMASRLAVTSFRSALGEYGLDEKAMLAAANIANESIRSAQVAGPHNRMASTLIAVALMEDRIVGIHCGDSRASIARGKGIRRLTTDHSEGQRLLEAGKLSKEELPSYPRKHILESALGVRDQPRIDTIHFDLLLGDRIILTTDGVHNLVPLREMQRLCASSSSPNALIEKVEEAVLEIGPADNFSMLALFVDA